MVYVVRAKTKSETKDYGKFRSKKVAQKRAFLFKQDVMSAVASNPKLKKQVGKFKISVVKK